METLVSLDHWQSFVIVSINKRKRENEMEQAAEKRSDKTIITVLGKDTVGIIAKVCTYLSEKNINVLDISQTIVQGYFHMMMIVEMNDSEVSFSNCSKELDKIGEAIGVSIKCQKEEIFEKMHRI